MRKLLLISLLTLTSTLHAQFTFTRGDSIVVTQAGDTLEYAWAGGMNFCQFSDIDVNLDGKKDLFVFDRTFNQLMTFINTGGVGQLKYKYEPKYETYFPSNLTNWVLMRDYNCDGKKDIFGYSPGGIMIYKNISDTVLKFQLITSLLRGTQCASLINIYVSSIDIPSIEDIDYDGDLDVLTFGIFGTFVEYHKNYSVELGYGCDSLKFTMKNQCWGHFKEDNDSCFIYLHQTTANCAGVGTPELAPYDPYYEDVITLVDPEEAASRDGATRHTGSTILAIDIDGINSKDIIEADISCKYMQMLINGGAAPNLDSDMMSDDTAFPSYDVPIDIDLFPAAFYVDVNNDAKRDLIAAPNSYTLSNNTDGNWLYYNTSTDTTPVFAFNGNGFMQNEMFEQGEGSAPVLFDYNMDGLMDLVIANYGFFTSSGVFMPKFALYKNTGTTTKPKYNLINADYANIFAALGKEGVLPTFGDMDNDGDEDMIVGDKDGNIHYFTNTAGAGFAATFTLTTPLMPDNLGATIDIGKYATPTLVDLDRDGDLDLVIGEYNANLNYYQNTGTVSAPVFTFVTNTLGGIDVSENWTPVGYSVPVFYDNAGDYTLFVGSQHGVIYQFDNIDGNLGGTFNMADSMCYQNKIGGRLGAAVGHLNSDARPDLIVGNYRGGLSLYYGVDNTSGVHEIENALNMEVFPNPASGMVTVRLQSAGNYTYSLIDMSGKRVSSGTFNANSASISIEALTNGVYVLQVSSANRFVKSVRVVKCGAR